MGKRDTSVLSLPSQNEVRREVQGSWSPPCAPKLAANFRAEFNPALKDSVFEKSPCVSFTEEDNGASEKETALEISEGKKWRKAALTVSIASLIASVLFCAASILGSATTDSSSVFASALDTLLAVFSASVVIWRFWNSSKGKIAPKREKHGSIAFGIAFTVNALIVIAIAGFHLVDESRPKHSGLLWPILMGFSLVYCVLAILEFWISKKLDSSVLVTLCIDDAVTSALLLGLSLSQWLLHHFHFVWYIDHIVAIALGLVILGCGIKILVEIFVYEELPFHVSS